MKAQLPHPITPGKTSDPRLAANEAFPSPCSAVCLPDFSQAMHVKRAAHSPAGPSWKAGEHPHTVASDRGLNLHVSTRPRLSGAAGTGFLAAAMSVVNRAEENRRFLGHARTGFLLEALPSLSQGVPLVRFLLWSSIDSGEFPAARCTRQKSSRRWKINAGHWGAASS